MATYNAHLSVADGCDVELALLERQRAANNHVQARIRRCTTYAECATEMEHQLLVHRAQMALAYFKRLVLLVNAHLSARGIFGDDTVDARTHFIPFYPGDGPSRTTE